MKLYQLSMRFLSINEIFLIETNIEKIHHHKK